jgi:predicted porin
MSIKKRALYGAISCLAFAATTAHAQSSVTLFGIVDAGITYFSNQGGHSSWAQTNGVDFPSTFGLSGTENLGGGTQAIFKLASNFKVTNGAVNIPGEMFSQEAYVGVQDETYGTIKLGRIRQPAVNLAPYVAAHGSIFGFHPGNYDGVVQAFLNNAVAYESPLWHGLEADAMYSFGSTSAPATNTGRAYGFRLAYTNGPFQAQTTLSNVIGVTINPAQIGLPSAFGKPAAQTVANGIALDRLLTTASNVSYDFGSLTLYGVYAYTNMNAYGVTERLQTGEADAVYKISPALFAGGGYAYSVGMGGRWHVFNASLHYALSKRTLLYLDGAYQHVTGAGQKAALLFSQTSSNAQQFAVTAGIRHSF